MIRRCLFRLAWASLALVVVSMGCDESVDVASQTAPPPSLRATVSIEPAQLEIGEVATVELRVVTPPNHRVLPFDPPEVPGVWLLESRALETERHAARWIHRTQLRLRPQDLGPVAWPDTSLAVENAEGQRVEILAPGRDLEVVSMFQGSPNRVNAYGYQLAEHAPRQHPVSGWLWAAGGALLGFGLAGLLGWSQAGWARQRPNPAAPDLDEADRGAPELYTWMEQELEAAVTEVDAEGGSARVAANRAAHALRLFVARRFRTETTAKTTPELKATRPPLRVQSRWPYFLRILESLDDLRFRPTSDVVNRTNQDDVRAAIGDARRFVEDTARRGGRKTP